MMFVLSKDIKKYIQKRSDMCFLPILKYILLKKSGEMPFTQVFEAQYLKKKCIYSLQILHVYSRTSLISENQMARQFVKEHEYLY